MFPRNISSTLRAGSRMTLVRNASTAPQPISPFRAFFKAAPVPIEAYPLMGLTAIMLGWAGYHSAKHIREDRDHLRWYPGAGVVRYEEPQWKELPIDL